MDSYIGSKASLLKAIYFIIIIIGGFLIYVAQSQSSPFLESLLLNVGSNLVVVTIVFAILQFFSGGIEQVIPEQGEKHYHLMEDQKNVYQTDIEINQYLYNWISNGRRVVIFTRDMSWANNNEIFDMLITKARKGELTICLPLPIDLTNKLKSEGAYIITFENMNYVPQSRFTIINKDRMDSQVAVGQRVNGQHIIEEFSLGQHPVFSVANDLIEILGHIRDRENVDDINTASK